MTTLTLRLESYDKDAKQLVHAAQSLADERKNAEVEPLHVLYRLVERDPNAQGAFERGGVDPADVLLEAEAQIRKLPKEKNGDVSFLSPRMHDLLGRAEGEAAREAKAVTPGHLFIACSQETTGPVKEVLKACGLSAPVLRATWGGDRVAVAGDAAPKAPQPAPKLASGAGPLEEFGQDLTQMAREGLFDPTVGRDAELRRILQVLARRRENNPVLVGDRGIGKTAIVHALAQRVARGDVPSMLADRRIVLLDLGAMVAGARLRGQLEERMRAVVQQVRDSAGHVLLFLPELASLVEGGNSSGAAGLLANALGRGDIRVIAVATPEDARKAFDASPALARRFVTIPVEPPTTDEATAVLRGVVSKFEVAHGVRIADPALVAAVTFARRYVPMVALPKSAIDLIDEAAAGVRVEMDGVPAALDSLERRVEAIEIQRRSLEDDHDPESLHIREKLDKELAALAPRATEMRQRWQAQIEVTRRVADRKRELEDAQRDHEKARTSEDHARAGELRFGAIPLLEKQLAEAEAARADLGVPLVHDTVTQEDIASVVAAWTGVPVAKMLEGEAEKLLKMEERLRDRVIGQPAAVEAVSKAVRRGRVGLRDPRRPIGSFLFLGPTGVGKTELAKALAEFLFDDEASLTRLDMSEFMEKHMVARLLGSPPGYVDSDEGGFLTEAVRRRPYSVVLFDEMEKAHPDVFNILLQVLDDGRLTDSRGRVAHFSDTVVIMTSNVGGHAILDHKGSHDELRDKIEGLLREHFRPEFLNRIDDVVIFNQLSREDLRGIVDIQLRALAKLVGSRRLSLEVEDRAKDQLVELGYEPAFGARPLKRVILKSLQDPLAEAVLRGGYAAGETVKVGYDGERFTFTRS